MPNAVVARRVHPAEHLVSGIAGIGRVAIAVSAIMIRFTILIAGGTVVRISDERDA